MQPPLNVAYRVKSLTENFPFGIGRKIYSPSPNTSQLAARMKARRTLRSLGEGGWKGFGEFRQDTSELCSEELYFNWSKGFAAASLAANFVP
jgi:hypothetical protein